MALHHPGYGKFYGYQPDYDRISRQKRVLELETERLRLRRWQMTDLEPFGKMRADAVGMEFFPSIVSPVGSLASIEQFEQHFDDRGYSFWAVESLDTEEFVGCAGFYTREWPAKVPRVAIGWQFVRAHWGKGYAKEAAKAVLKDGFKRLKLNEVIAVVAETNERSKRVAEALGMKAEPRPLVELARGMEIHPLCSEVIYRIRPSLRR